MSRATSRASRAKREACRRGRDSRLRRHERRSGEPDAAPRSFSLLLGAFRSSPGTTARFLRRSAALRIEVLRIEELDADWLVLVGLAHLEESVSLRFVRDASA